LLQLVWKQNERHPGLDQESANLVRLGSAPFVNTRVALSISRVRAFL